ncbi:MAG: coniferyl aldehyde dehydrogenase [Proteobacteria bacterium]|nr:coniferyl aldehyde dehydrogenase [Pseudomonadota bacterium]
MDLDAILKAQRIAAEAERPTPLALRQDRLTRAIRMMVDNAEDFCAALSADFGHRSRELSMLTDIAGSIRSLKHARKHAGRWMKRERRKLDFPLGLLGARAWIDYQPKGVVGVISPWNFPVQLTMSPLAGIFAAGNRAMVKSSEFTPRTSALFEKLAGRYFDPVELTFVSGGADIGEAFSKLPFDHLIFTGATGIGRHILHAAADNLTPVTLELGGKSPVILGRSADMAQATMRIATGKMMNAGQICLAPDYVLVPDDREEAAIDGLKSAAASLYPRLLDNADYTAIVNERHHLRLQSYLEDAHAKGGEVITVNPAGEDFAASNGTRMPFTIVRNPTDDMAVMRDEIFGPVLPVKTYRAIDDAIAYVNGRDRPLGLYYFGTDEAEQTRVLEHTVSGGVTINDVIFHISAEELPFGGIGPSGMGSYHGFEGFKTFSHAKSVYRQPKIDVAKLAGFKPPYGRATQATIKRELKI